MAQSTVAVRFPHNELVLERDKDGQPTKSITREPQEVTADELKKVQEVADKAGVPLTVSESEGQAESSTAPQTPVARRAAQQTGE